mgnify:CR=1 FL=1
MRIWGMYGGSPGRHVSEEANLGYVRGSPGRHVSEGANMGYGRGKSGEGRGLGCEEGVCTGGVLGGARKRGVTWGREGGGSRGISKNKRNRGRTQRMMGGHEVKQKHTEVTRT